MRSGRFEFRNKEGYEELPRTISDRARVGVRQRSHARTELAAIGVRTLSTTVPLTSSVRLQTGNWRASSMTHLSRRSKARTLGLAHALSGLTRRWPGRVDGVRVGQFRAVQLSFSTSTLPWPPSPTATPRIVLCLSQRPGLSITPAVAPDGTRQREGTRQTEPHDNTRLNSSA